MPYIPYDAILGASTIRQLMRSTFDPQQKFDKRAAAGATAVSQIPLMEAEPRWQAESQDLVGVLTAIPLATGLAIASGTVTLPFEARAQGATFQSGSNHYSVSGSNLLAVVTEIKGQIGGFASCDIEARFRSTDGLTVPYTENSAVALAASAFNATFRMGPCVVNGVTVTDLQRTSVKTGLEITARRGSGGIYPDILNLNTPFEPMIEISAWNLAQSSPAITSVVQYFRRQQDGAPVADGTASHIAITLTGGITQTGSVGGSEGDDSDKSLTFHGDSISINLASTISA